MKRVRLELDYIEIQRRRRRWNLYFIIATEDPLNPNKTVMTIAPSHTIRLHPSDHNRIDFEPKGDDDNLNGMFVLECEMPQDFSIKARLWVIQCRDKTRDLGEVLQAISGSTKVDSTVTSLLGGALPWFTVAKSIVAIGGVVGEFFKHSKDAKKGFVSMDQSFSKDEQEDGEFDRYNRLAGFGEVGWTWVVE